MRRLPVLLALALIVAALPASARLAVPAAVPAAVPDPTGLISSPNVELLSTIPEPGVIGARMRGTLMYVTATTGLAIYDIAQARAPRLVSRLALPHFENEDVDLGGDILLVSNDAAESRGILHVVDVKDPAAPKLLTSFDMGGIAGLGGPGHTTSCVLDCRFAWTTDGGGITVIDLRNPAVPVKLGTHATPAGGLVTHDVQFDGTYHWISGFDGVAAYEVPADYAGVGLGRLVTVTNDAGKSRYDETFGTDDGSTRNDYILHNSLHRPGSTTVYVTEEDYSRPGCRGAGSFQRWTIPIDEETKLPTGEPMTPLGDMWVTELIEDTAQPSVQCSAHYFDENQGLIAQAWYQQGLRFLDVTGDEIRQVGFLVSPADMNWAAYFALTDPTGQTVYSLNAARGIDVVAIDRTPDAAPTVVAPVLPSWTAPVAGFTPSARYGGCLLST